MFKTDHRKYHDLGLRAISSGNLIDGIAYLQRAVELAPRNSQYRYNLGLALANRSSSFAHRDEDLKFVTQTLILATEHLQRAVDLAPRYREAWLALGKTHMALDAITSAWALADGPRPHRDSALAALTHCVSLSKSPDELFRLAKQWLYELSS